MQVKEVTNLGPLNEDYYVLVQQSPDFRLMRKLCDILDNICTWNSLEVL